MAYSESGTASGYLDLLAKIDTFVTSTLPVAERYTILRSVTSGANYEKIWKAPGLSADKEIFFGIKTYSNVSSDYYNFKINGFTGYTSGNPFENQPQALSTSKGIPLYTSSLPYWISGDGQGFTCVVKVVNKYQFITLGFLNKFGTFQQWPYPLFVGGMLIDESATRYDGVYNVWWKGGTANCNIRDAGGNWVNPYVDCYACSTATYLRNTNNDKTSNSGYYGLSTLNILTTTNVYGSIPKLFHIPGFQNAPENTITISGTNYVVFTNGSNNTLNDYIALAML